MNCQACIRAQRKRGRLCAAHQRAEAARQAKLRLRRKTEGRCRCGKELPTGFVTVRGENFERECYQCSQAREPKRVYSVELFSVVNPKTGKYEMRSRRGSLLSETVTAKIRSEIAKFKAQGLKVKIEDFSREDVNEVTQDRLV